MHLEDLNLVAVGSRPGQVAKSKPGRETVVRAFQREEMFLWFCQRDTVLERRDFVIVRKDFKKALRRFTREFLKQCKYPV